MDKIKVLLVDDHFFYREGLQRIIELDEELGIIGQVEDGESVIPTIEQLQPDVVLLDVELPNLSGMEVIARLRAQRNKTAVVILTAHTDHQQPLLAIQGGAMGYCAKDVLPERLIEIIKQVHQGYYAIHDKTYDAETVTAWIDAGLSELAGPYLEEDVRPHTPLSAREMEVLRLVARGFANQAIAYRLGITHQTVKNHMTNILKKLNVQDRTQAAMYAVRYGWVRPGESDEDENHDQA